MANHDVCHFSSCELTFSLEIKAAIDWKFFSALQLIYFCETHERTLLQIQKKN